MEKILNENSPEMKRFARALRQYNNRNNEEYIRAMARAVRKEEEARARWNRIFYDEYKKTEPKKQGFWSWLFS